MGWLPWRGTGLIAGAHAQGNEREPASGLPYVSETSSERVLTLALRSRLGALHMGQGTEQKEVFILEPETSAPLSYPVGTVLRVTFTNDLPLPAVLNWYGIDGSPDATPFTSQNMIKTGLSSTYDIILNQSGTIFCQTLLPGQNAAASLTLRAEEPEKQDIDHDEIALIEEFWLPDNGQEKSSRTDGKEAGKQAEKPTGRLFTLNRERSADFLVRTNSRTRIRFINSSQNTVIALKIQDHEAQVVAIDSRPAEPYLAHDSQLVLAPGTRIDVVIDTLLIPGSRADILLHDGKDVCTIGRLIYSSEPPIRPAPLTNPISFSKASPKGLPEKLDLARATRADLSLDAPVWLPISGAKVANQPVFRVKQGRVVVLTIKNPTNNAITFRLQGHHFRLLDRLDDGWKPFWLDTLRLAPGSTERITFLAEFPGSYLLETRNGDRNMPNQVAWYAVE